MTPEQFIGKWEASTLKERSAAQSHFNDLCEMLGVDKPTDVDTSGDWYCFERGASKTTGGEGWADVWKKGHFGWEYKGKRKDLTAAYAQLQQYAVALENPPLLVVSDMDHFVIHTNWTNTVSETHHIKIQDLSDANQRDKLRWLFTEPDRLRPAKTIDALTREAADTFASLAISLSKVHDPHAVAHFVNRLVFCMFAEDIGLLPRKIFNLILEKSIKKPLVAQGMLEQLFGAMQKGGPFGVDEIEWFNGGLFDDATALPLTKNDLESIGAAAALDWSDIDPSIFGTLFERGLDPEKRGQLGAHYTDPEKIMMIIRPVIIDPLTREWNGIRERIEHAKTSAKRKRELLNGFLERLRSFRVLDPACGSGNFLYLSLLAIKDLEHRVNLEGEILGLGRQFPTVGPEVVRGIELSSYAAELARVTVWIGEIQWMRKNGFDVSKTPILRPLQNIDHRDALINEDGTEASWPDADVIVGNPPFLGSRKLQPELGPEYTAKIRRLYRGRVDEGADLVCFWFAKAWQAVENGGAQHVGLVSTNSITGGASREVLEPIARNGRIFEAWRDEPWTVDGAAVRVSLVCFGREKAKAPLLDGKPVSTIFADLHAPSDGEAFDLSRAKILDANIDVAFQGVVPRSQLNKKAAVKLKLPPASFVLPGGIARELLALPVNPNGRPNSDVVLPFLVGNDVTNRPKDRFIVDFRDMTESQAALYEAPYAYIEPVKAHRANMTQPEALLSWWQHWRSRPELRAAIASLDRFIVSPRVAKYRLFAWRKPPIVADNAVVVIARSDDMTFGIVHSRFHEIWSLRRGTFLGVGNDPRYTPTTSFSTFAFPDGLTPKLAANDLEKNAHGRAIAEVARELNRLRENWLNPTGLVTSIPEVVGHFPERLVPVDDKAAKELTKRTLTKLYNAKPKWLIDAHRSVDEAVGAAYGISADAKPDEVLRFFLELNVSRGGSKLSVVDDDETDEEV
ncbi:class I SAM-dependent DNA methyltransferase [Mesorhizobium sp. Cs1299R1N3]|uniref:class I SAM-dependent DNA methyltransferase n=1 Tax=Mesorhizobium sp. Cs1299R1N3 TaxID=3015173 RepID=UPI00301CD78F